MVTQIYYVHFYLSYVLQVFIFLVNRLGQMSRLFAAYSRCLSKWPLGTQMLSAGVIGTCGDGFCQFAVERKSLKEYDVGRGIRFFVLPAFYIAPILSRWFRVLERVGGNPKTLPLKRVLIDQAFFAPPFSASIIFNLHLLQGSSLKESYRKLKNQFIDIYKRSITYWPIVQLINFYIIPLNMRVIVVQLAALFWNSFLSYKTNRPGTIPPLE
ncbi:Mpv17-like protein [Aphelenchoides bicaudatus]|nr:Mpv17-like protein [Aphelenchoides bicaudatus]